MSIRSQTEFDKLRAIGRIVRKALDGTTAAVAGVTTRELDKIGVGYWRRSRTESAPPKVYDFPGTLCISVNDEAIHGVPGAREIELAILSKAT